MARLFRDLVIDQYADFEEHWRWLNPDRTPLNLTDYYFKCQFRTAAGNPVLAEFDNADLGGITVDLATARITLTIPKAMTALFTWTRAEYDVIAVSPTGRETRLVKGYGTVSPGITKND